LISKIVTGKSAIIASVLIVAIAMIIWRLSIIRSPIHDSLARPTPLFWTEAEIVLAFFVALLIFKKPFSSFNLRFLNRPLKLPRALRFVTLFLSFVCILVFGFWAYLDVTGGYGGGYQLDNHKWMETIYNTIHMGQFPLPPDKDGPLFFLLALGMMFVFRLNKGAWSAFKDVVTFYGAPILVACELSLWYYAVEDMTWHVTSWLWVGGYNDGGWEHVASQYVFSNWIALFLCSILVVSRLPFLTRISSLMWSRVRYQRLPVIIGLVVLIAISYSAYIPLVVAWKW
jgi:hypothetical protein